MAVGVEKEVHVGEAQAGDKQANSRGFDYTQYEANSWACTFLKSGVNVLCDPWLTGDLVFGGQTWLYRGKKTAVRDLDVPSIGQSADLLVLSQGLPDHAHVPTLRQLPKELPVVASPAAARIAADLGFKRVYELDHGQEMVLADGRLRVKATAGALVGPPWSKRENGFHFTELVDGGISLYYEPHCDYDEGSLAGIERVDIVISPCVNQNLSAFPLVLGNDNIERLCRRLRPRVLVPLTNAEFESEGPLSGAIRQGAQSQAERMIAGLGWAAAQTTTAPGSKDG
ncbi:hypothetical protein WJX81_004928 [Elliptochloris bilobata]|uniref:MBL fold metallo-hydrolase n=1 Tax=Elliptochloris bilobata TaxID=381761 RepID=A0AAW1QXJ6_9CHLO